MAVPAASENEASPGNCEDEDGSEKMDPRSKVTTPIEPRSVRHFESGEEYLYAMKEDLAEWLQSLYEDLQVDADGFFEALDTGVLLCRHANYVLQGAREAPGPRARWPRVVYKTCVQPGTFQARDNISQFIGWCRGWLRVKECLLFETDDLVERKNERNVVLCLLEVARRGCDLCEGMPAPLLVQMEREIDAEVARDEKGLRRRNMQAFRRPCRLLDAATMTSAAALGVIESSDDGGNGGHEADDDDPPSEDDGQLENRPQVITNDLRSLHQRVASLLNMCSCPSQFPMLRVADGKYRIGDTQVLIFVRVLRNHVMVRVGGGWDTLDHYLEKHDPCRGRAGRRLSSGYVNKMVGGSRHKQQVNQNRPRSCGTPTSRYASSPFVSPPTSQRRRSYDFSSRLSSPDDMHSASVSSSRTPSRGSSPRAGSLHEEEHWQTRRPPTHNRRPQSDCSSSEFSEEGCDQRWKRSSHTQRKSSPKKITRYNENGCEESEVDSIYSSPPRSLDSCGRKSLRSTKSPSLVSDDSAVSLDTLAKSKSPVRSRIPKSQPVPPPTGRQSSRLSSSRSETSLVASCGYSSNHSNSLRERTPTRGRRTPTLSRSNSGTSPFVPPTSKRRSLSATRPPKTPSREYRPVVPPRTSNMNASRRSSAIPSSCQSSPGKPVAPLLEEILHDTESLDTDEKLLRKMEQLIDEYRCRARHDDFDDVTEDTTTACFSLSLDDDDPSSIQSLVIQETPTKRTKPSNNSLVTTKLSKIPVFTAWQAKDN